MRSIRELIPDYPFLSCNDPGVSETELRAQAQVYTEAIAILRHNRNNCEQMMSERYVKGLVNEKKQESLRSRPYNPDLAEVYKRKEKRWKRL